ncbi:MAG: SDR family oxidoreductase [Calditrichaeota bacterium]|nr:MAG: SDR family oxidoreductase [Calditrichota bacterium]
MGEVQTDFQGKVALITGASGALGQAVARAFAGAGSRLVLSAHSARGREKLENMVDTLGASCMCVRADLSQENAVRDLVSQGEEKFHRIDFLLNLAGGFVGGVEVAETSEAQWHRMMELNFKSAFLCCKHVIPVMRRQGFGRIVNVGARAALGGAAGMAIYAASKAALLNFTQTLADELREDNITANIVLPSIIDTEANRAAMPEANFSRWVRPEALAQTLLFLCSDAAGEISGAAIPVFGKA